MGTRGLLSRLDADGLAPPAEPLDSILEHLRAVLNTRKGEAVTAPELGITDFTDLVHAFPHCLHALQQSIRSTLLTYEPRLRNVSVRHVPDDDPLTVRFEISGQLADKAGRGTLRFRTVMTPGGTFEVS